MASWKMVDRLGMGVKRGRLGVGVEPSGEGGTAFVDKGDGRG